MLKTDIEGFISNNFKNIFIDNNIYSDERYENRLRFTLAHEVGHLILHKNIILKCKFRTENEWINFREDMSEDDLDWFEWQAYEFAGRLLVPKNVLLKEIEKHKEKIDKYYEGFDNNKDEMIIKAISRVVCTKFKVSDNVII